MYMYMCIYLCSGGVRACPTKEAGAENCVQVFGAGPQANKLGDVDCNAKRPFYCMKYL